MIVVTCKQCGQEFNSMRVDHRYCSPQCREKRDNLAMNEKWLSKKPKKLRPKKVRHED